MDAAPDRSSGSRTRWWQLPIVLPRLLWRTSGDLTDLLTDTFRRRSGKWTTRAIHAGNFVLVLLVAPLSLVYARRWRNATAADVLDKRARELWETSPFDAIALVRATLDQLVAAGGYEGMKAVTIDGLGKFSPGGVVSVQQFLYDCEIALGRYEQALAVGRKPEAIALLEQNVDRDDRRGKLRNRLRELSGRSHLKLV